MTHKIGSFILLIVMALFIVSCGTSPTPTPPPTQPPQVITVVITATPPPATATPLQPSITPVPTVAITTTVATPTKVAVATAVSSKPAASRAPTKRAVSPTATATATATALPLKFGAPILNRPIWTENQRDEVKFPGGAIVFDWQSVGGLGGDECYLLQVNTEPVNPGPGIGAASDYWVVRCGDQTPRGYSVKFVLESPNRVGSQPSYTSLLLQTSQMWAHWSITVVKNLGQCDPVYSFHCKYAPLSPAGKGTFLFKGS